MEQLFLLTPKMVYHSPECEDFAQEGGGGGGDGGGERFGGGLDFAALLEFATEYHSNRSFFVRTLQPFLLTSISASSIKSVLYWKRVFSSWPLSR